MYMRIFLSAVFVLLFGAANAAVRLDSINVENLNGRKVILHKVEAKESYYSISRKYQVSPQSVINFNSNVALKPGGIIRIPTERPYQEPQSQAMNSSSPPDNMAVVDYKVGPKEYLLMIARKFNTTVEDLKKLNNLTSNNLAIGQIIKVPYGTANQQLSAGPPPALDTPRADPRNTPTVIDSTVNASERLKLPPARYGLREVDERGVAVWISDETLDGGKMLALHQTAPIGTVVKITNPMSGKSTFVKVVGKFAPNESTKGAIIVVTKASAELIGALDKRFQATIVYGVPNE